MNEFLLHITKGQNNKAVKCPFCNSFILSQNSATFCKQDESLPTITQKKDGPSTETELVSDWWLVDDMFTFENIGFTHSVGTVKYLSCADCERGPIGYHDTETKKNYIALVRVQHS